MASIEIIQGKHCNEIRDGYSEDYNAHRRSANARIRAALAEKEGKE